MVSTNFFGATREVFGFGLAVMVASLVVLLAPRPAHAATFVVDSTADTNTGACTAATSDCTLRGAINASNASTTINDTINFDIPDDPGIPGLEVKTISPTSEELPPIEDTVTINGYTQPGASENTATTNANNAVPKIEISGAGAGVNADGLTVESSAAGTTIRGLVINRFDADGVFIDAANTVIEGNFIGTNAAGDADAGNGLNGVRVLFSGYRIGGAANAAQNIISGNTQNGVFVAGGLSSGVISNNHIGTDADAGEDLGNSLNGVHVLNAPDVIVGGNDANGANGAGQDNGPVKGEGNIISGNDRHGVLIDNLGAEGTKVLGNLIGLNRNGSGSSNIGNTLDGVRVPSAPRVEIGGTQAGQGNTISDNGQHGIEIAATSATFNKVLGNRIGTNFNGGSDFGNTLDGVRIGNASNTTIGGTSAGSRNVISGNDANGVFISGTSGALNNKVEGNFIGTDALGAASLGNNLGNAEAGVRVETPGNFVGGTASGARNVISGNGGAGVSMLGAGASGNTVQGNLIGPDVNGAQTVGGNLHGVFVSDAPNNTIGGTVAAAANTISGNDNQGVQIVGASATGNRVLRNSIFENGLLGIALNDDGVTANDPKDPDSGPNLLQNFPVISSATTTRIRGTLTSTKNTTFTVQLFSNPQPNFPTGFGEGQNFLGEISVTTNRKGKASFAFNGAVPAGHLVTATATDANGNTSEFSAARAVQ